MVRHVGQKLHKLIYGLAEPSDDRELSDLYNKLLRTFSQHAIDTEKGRDDFMMAIAFDVVDSLSIPSRGVDQVCDLIASLFDYEDFLILPPIDLSDKRTTAEKWDLKDELKELRKLYSSLPKLKTAITQMLLTALAPIRNAVKSTTRQDGLDSGLKFGTRRIDRVADLPSCVETMMFSVFSDDIEELGIFKRLRQRLETNLIIASDGNPNDPNGFTKAHRMPGKFQFKEPEELISAYLGGTPLQHLFDGVEEFIIPDDIRYEHQHIIAGSGHGKTQLLQTLIAQDLPEVEKGRRSIVVIDSQGDLIRNISRLAVFAEGGPLHDRICIIDPNDVKYPVALNMFDIGQDRLKHYGALERERLNNSIVELYDFILGSLLSAQMTQKQDVLFKFVTRLMMVIPNATIYTFRDLFEAKGIEGFEEHVAKLDDTARHFFERDFSNDKEYGQTKSQVRRRLMGVLENKTFERMFAQPQSKLDLFSEMNSGKVILIDTAKSLLKQSNTETFGRFFIALIAQAAQERAVIPEKNRMPTFVYIDEAADYFDQNIETILREARKYKVGMVLAHQYLGQLPGNLERAFSANTSIKFAGGVSYEDSKSLAGKLQCEASFIQRQPKLSFAAFVDAHTESAISLRIPFGTIEQMPKMTKEQRKVLRKKMRKRYANPAKMFAKKNKRPSKDEATEANVSDAGPDSDVEEKNSPEKSFKHTPTAEEVTKPKKRKHPRAPRAKEPPMKDGKPQKEGSQSKKSSKAGKNRKQPPPDGDRPDTDPTPDW